MNTNTQKTDILDIVKTAKQPSDELVLIFDIDGTLTSKQGISLEVIKILRNINCQIVFASGRNISALHFLAKDIGVRNAILIGQNGGTYRLPTGNYAQIIRFKKTRMKKIIKFLQEKKYIASGPELDNTRMSDYLINKKDLLVSSEKINQVINEQFGNKYTFTDSGSSHIHLHLKSVTKGSTLSKIIRHLKISKSKTIAFGNADNDVSMFEKVKIGVAVKDASHKLLQVASYISQNDAGKGVLQGLLLYVFKIPLYKVTQYVNQL